MSDGRIHGDDPSHRERIGSVVTTALGEWQYLLSGSLFAATLVYAVVNQRIGASEPASEAFFAAVALASPGVVARRTARESDAVPDDEGGSDGPGVRP
jgi:hypothetical protein